MPLGAAAKQISASASKAHSDNALLKENVPNEILEALRSKEESVRSLQDALESERRKRRQLQADAATERAAARDHFDSTEADLRRRIEAAESECARRLDEMKGQRERLQDQLELARARESDLLAKNDSLATDLRAMVERAEAEDADGLALRARAAAVGGDLAEAQEALRTAETVQEEMRRQLEQRDAEIVSLRNQLQEVHQNERAARETGAAQFERLTFQCETLTRQVHEKTREADVFGEKNVRVETELKKAQLELEKERQEATVRVQDTQAALEKEKANVRALHIEIKDKGALEGKLRETVASLEMELEKRKDQEQQLRKEIFQAKTDTQEAAGERDVAREAGRKREAHLNKALSELEDKLGTAEASLESRLAEVYSTRGQMRTTELELQSAQEAITALRAEVSSVREAEQAMRASAVKQLQDALQKRDADVLQLQGELARQKEECAKLKGELDGEMNRSSDLADRMKDLQAKSMEFDVSREEFTSMKIAHENLKSELNAELQRTKGSTEGGQIALVSEKETMTSPRLIPQGGASGVRGREWNSEIDGLYRQLSSLRSAVGDAASQSRRAATHGDSDDDSFGDLQPLPTRSSSKKLATPPREIAGKRSSMSSLAGSPVPSVGASDCPDDLRAQPVRQSSRVDDLRALPVRQSSGISRRGSREASEWGEVDMDRVRLGTLRYFSRKLTIIQNRGLLWDTWLLWASAHNMVVRARVDAAAADEVQLATECAAREAGLHDILTARQMTGEGSMRVVKRLLLEFRHRLASALCEALPQGDSSLEMRRTALVRLLDVGRSSFGRVLNAAMFFYQKLRTLVPSELLEAVDDPLSGVVPLPFYVKAYKVKHALKKMAAQSQKTSPPNTSLASRVEELEEKLPLNARSFFDVPHFIADVAGMRAQAASAKEEEGNGSQSVPHLRDRLDVLLVDSLTVYMSAWRLVPTQVGPLDSGPPRNISNLRRSSSPAATIPSRSSAYPSSSQRAGVGRTTENERANSYSPRLRLGQRPLAP